MSLSLVTLEEVRRFGDELEEEAGPPRQSVTLAEVQSLRLWRFNGHEDIRAELEHRAAPRRRDKRRRQEERRKEAERRRWVEAELELKRQDKRRRLAEWDAIFAIGAEDTERRQEAELERRRDAERRAMAAAKAKRRQEAELEREEGRARLNAALDAIAIKYPEEADRVERARKHC